MVPNGVGQKALMCRILTLILDRVSRAVAECAVFFRLSLILPTINCLLVARCAAGFGGSSMAVQQQAPAQALEQKLLERTARVGVLGLGYAGLPMAVEIAQAGFSVTGLDINRARVDAVNAGASPVSDVDDVTIRDLLGRE